MKRKPNYEVIVDKGDFRVVRTVKHFDIERLISDVWTPINEGTSDLSVALLALDRMLGVVDDYFTPQQWRSLYTKPVARRASHAGA